MTYAETLVDPASPPAAPARHEGGGRGAAVEVRGLRKSYGATAVLDGIDLTVEPGTVLALLGPNGAGKTTTVRILATLLRPDGGTARIGGHDVVAEPDAVRSLIRLTGQCAAVDDQQTGRENLVMVGQLWHLGRRGARARATELLERFDLVDAADRRVETWSGGMRRRLDLATSLVTTPRVLFLDEPTSGLDPTSRSTVWQVVRDLVADGITVLLTTQYLEEADRLADRIVLIDGGRVVADGRADELKAFVGGTRLDLRLPADAGPEAVATAVRTLDGLGLAPLVPEDGDGSTIAVPSDGSADAVRLALDALAAAGVPVASVAQHQPTLDDVFTTLTGEGRP
jgi:ABC-2 type transport system ATP-binding protein